MPKPLVSGWGLESEAGHMFLMASRDRRVMRRQARKTGERFRVCLVNGRRICLLRSIYG